MKRIVAKIGVFVVFLLLVLYFTNNIFKFKYYDGIYSMTKYYEQPDESIDVLFLGSSHAFTSFNTGVFWNEYGIPSYVLAGPGQPLWNTYYYLKEALKYQKPKMIVLEGYLTASDEEFSDKTKMMKNLFGMRFSFDKLAAFTESVPREEWKDYFFEYIQYHSRYDKLSIEDFYRDQGTKEFYNWKGFVGIKRFDGSLVHNNVADVKETEELYEKEEKYYRKIIELANKQDIPILIVITPYADISEEEKKRYNRAAEIADDYDVDFIDFNTYSDKMGLDFAKDAADLGHLNLYGSIKYSEYLGDYLVKSYELDDHRGDLKYSSWEKNYEFYDEERNVFNLVNCKDIASLSEEIKKGRYLVVISVDGSCNVEETKIISFFNSLGLEGDNKGLWIINQDEKVSIADIEKRQMCIPLDVHEVYVRQLGNDSECSNEIYIDGNLYKKVNNGINIVVYDIATGRIADFIGLNADKEYEIER